jgi:hypothetical protein
VELQVDAGITSLMKALDPLRAVPAVGIVLCGTGVLVLVTWILMRPNTKHALRSRAPTAFLWIRRLWSRFPQLRAR